MESILDRVKDHASDLKRQVSRADQTKLDEYLSSVRDVERLVDGHILTAPAGSREGGGQAIHRPIHRRDPQHLGCSADGEGTA